METVGTVRNLIDRIERVMPAVGQPGDSGSVNLIDRIERTYLLDRCAEPVPCVRNLIDRIERMITSLNVCLLSLLS